METTTIDNTNQQNVNEPPVNTEEGSLVQTQGILEETAQMESKSDEELTGEENTEPSILICNTFNLKLYKDAAFYYRDYLVRTDISKAQIDSEIPNEQVFYGVGEFFYMSLQNKPHLISYKIFPDKKSCRIEMQVDIEQFYVFMNILWLVKDNSCNVDTLTVLTPQSFSYKIDRIKVFSNARGKFEDSDFSHTEIELAIFYYDLLSDIMTISPKPTLDDVSNTHKVVSSTANSLNFNELNRVTRAFQFLIYARQSSHIPTKISFYVLVLECLFSANDSEEIVHKVSERIALYMRETLEDRIRLYAEVKDYYAIRSKFFHGQEFEKKEHKNVEKLTERSVQLDKLVRMIFIKIVRDNPKEFLSQKSEFADFFQKLVFSKSIESLANPNNTDTSTENVL